MGFEIEWVDGVRGESVPDKAVPNGVDRKKLWENNLGSWRGHMNAIRLAVERNYSSVLLMEDDMDWVSISNFLYFISIIAIWFMIGYIY